ncbi:MAG: Zn-dependent alcohol dehydrogenase [Gammaproteobacteria bacterium]|nr:Zn-dependent alcohol dehydrogenase [Gammaproteobacteria bacterium]NIR85037.1 Zn-dependent alcohol dehydrogenase [Gammaproteobacteria bacterium]NIR88304.1 Zn-dependent alcohol dehydrogenase [Gammaproteobacteria bacterium]NIU06084.1 Zn-dependent alcohol dehydrogenase [Gammaproteobacteria bacterium]NIV73503.1 zinc-binding dehydrogenase [Gammaproteobacteria bacterium]
MKAAVCYAFGKPLVVDDIEIDPPGAGEVEVKIAACAICGSDLTAMHGGWGGHLPAVYGHEAAGIVQEVGAGVTALEPGDPVVVSLLRSCGACYFCTHHESHLCEGGFDSDDEGRLHGADGRTIHQGLRTGAFAERVLVHQSQAVRIPREVPLESASLLACGVITGWGAVVNTARVPAGAGVVVVGAGGVGLNSIQGAALVGADPIIAVDISDEKLDAAGCFGATHAINAGAGDVRTAVRALTGGRGADFAFVATGSATALEQSLELVRRAGTVVVVGMPAYGARVQIPAADFVGDAQRIVGSKMGSARLERDVPKLVALYLQGRLKLDELIDARYPLQAINEAVDAARRGATLRNVIVF